MKGKQKKLYKKRNIKKLKLCHRRVISFSLSYICTKFKKNSLKNGGLERKLKFSKSQKNSCNFLYMKKNQKFENNKSVLKLNFTSDEKNLIKIGA